MKILKSKVAGMTDLQYTKRHNLIKQVAKKRALEAARDAEMVREDKALERQLKKEGFNDDNNKPKVDGSLLVLIIKTFFSLSFFLTLT